MRRLMLKHIDSILEASAVVFAIAVAVAALVFLGSFAGEGEILR